MMPHPRVVLQPALCLALLAGCASGYDGSDLVPGKSSEAEVEKQMGKVADKRVGPDGSTVLWFPRLPWGRVSYAATIGKDGKLVSVEQRLTKDNMQKLKAGVSRESDVRDLLGPPAEVTNFARRQRVAWTYQAQGVEPQLIVVEFSPDGFMRDAFMMDDPAMRSRDGLM
jgi:hypothetical protein